MGNILTRLDQFGEKVQLRWGRNDKLQSMPGAIITSLVIIVVAVVGARLLFNVIDSTNVEVSTSQQYSEFYPRYDVIESGLFPVIILTDGGGVSTILDPKNNNRFITVEMVTVQLNPPTTPDVLETKTLRTIKYRPCSEIRDKYLEQYFFREGNIKKFIINLGICPDFEGDYTNFYVEGNFVHSPRTDIWLRIYPCSLEDSEECAEYSKVLGMDLMIMLPQVNFDPENHENPISIRMDASFLVGI